MLLLSISNAFDAIWHSQGERVDFKTLGLLVRFDARTAAAGRKCLALTLFLHHRAGYWCRTIYRPARGFIEFHTFILPVLRVCSSLREMPNSPVRICDASAGDLTAALPF